VGLFDIYSRGGNTILQAFTSFYKACKDCLIFDKRVHVVRSELKKHSFLNMFGFSDRYVALSNCIAYCQISAQLASKLQKPQNFKFFSGSNRVTRSKQTRKFNLKIKSLKNARTARTVKSIR
jgi:hypothetical protein